MKRIKKNPEKASVVDVEVDLKLMDDEKQTLRVMFSPTIEK